MNKYFSEPKYNAAFDRFVDVMSKMLLKYGPQLIDKWDKEKPPATSNMDLVLPQSVAQEASPLPHKPHKILFYTLRIPSKIPPCIVLAN